MQQSPENGALSVPGDPVLRPSEFTPAGPQWPLGEVCVSPHFTDEAHTGGGQRALLTWTWVLWAAGAVEGPLCLWGTPA